jgi:hypothetical protein
VEDGREFIVKDADLQAFLDAAVGWVKGEPQNMDTGLHMISMLERVEARLAATPVQAAVVPDGYVLVPVVPTTEMIEAGCNADPERESVWAAYLSAAPSPAPVQPADAAPVEAVPVDGIDAATFKSVMDTISETYQQGRAAGIEEAAKLAQEFGPSRPIADRTPNEIVRGRWEGEQAASSNIASAIRALAAPSEHKGAA